MRQYLQQIWKFRDAQPPTQASMVNYDVSTSCIFLVEKFRSIRSLLTSKNPGIWSVGKQYNS